MNTGAYALSENFLYTVEAMKDYFERLNADGIVSFYRWLFHPPRESLRLTSLAITAWKELGVSDFEKRIIVVGDGRWALSMFKNSPFTERELASVKNRLIEKKQFLLYWPEAIGRAVINKSEHFVDAPDEVVRTSKVFFELVAAFANGKEKDFVKGYKFNVQPTTDDSPFFFEYHFLNYFGLPNLSSLRGNSVGLTLYVVLAQASVLILLSIFLPLWKYSREGLQFRGALPLSVYFAALGAGFMLIEIALVQKCVLFLGSPLHALSVVLAGLLVSASIGSYWQSKKNIDLTFLGHIVGPLFLFVVVALIFYLQPLFYSLLHLDFSTRIFVVLLVLLPIGIIMGMFFPSGLQAAKNQNVRYVPWAWGINGCCSVYGSIFAIILGMAYGFSYSLVVGALVYAIGFIALEFVSFSTEGSRGTV